MGAGPAITSPVMRFLGVTDAAASAAFYRDVLGFTIRETADGLEAVSGPARLLLGRHGYPPNAWDEARPAGSAIVFFRVNDVAGMHRLVRDRGGTPSNIEKVNWIKMTMFEIRDPDGHPLWFGQSHHEEGQAPPPPMMQAALPELPFDDVAAAVAYYRDVLGFGINYQQHDLGVMDRDRITVLLIQRTASHTGIGSCEVYIADADALYAELRDKGARIVEPPVSQPWGLRTFEVRDPEGNRITFAERFE